MYVSAADDLDLFAGKQLRQPGTLSPWMSTSAMSWWIGLLDSFQRSHACVCCRSPIVLPLSCPRPVHVHQSGCSLIHRTALWKTSLLRKKGSTQLKTMRWAELCERDMRQQGSPLSVPGTPGTSQIHPSKGEVETQIIKRVGWKY